MQLLKVFGLGAGHHLMQLLKVFGLGTRNNIEP